MKIILLASNNANKIKELTALLSEFNVEIRSLNDLKIGEPIEDGKTFQENSLIKAKFGFEKTGLPTLADDSGFCIDSLNNFPGLFSSRFEKAVGGYEKCFEILNKMKTDNKAHFTTCISFIYKKNDKITEKCFEGKCPGEFIYPAKGDNNFGYDPVFKMDGMDKTFAEIPNEIKNKISHRAIAFKMFLDFYKKEMVAGDGFEPTTFRL
ncbi:MAG: RdgB/HAM1 family non-canonical purine NTP pyrophosphatase [Rickettsiales bacterium]|nr:RdgB/HAM1 family non-canonical purine NTP pyrophosphatase [Rickettsiales bacterium]